MHTHTCILFNFRHDDLLNKNGVYAEMWSQQSQAENEENRASRNSNESDKDK